MLRVIDIRKSFGGNEVLKGVSFEVGRGEAVGIIGPNGSGKTTLLNIISGIIRQDSGEILFEDRPISRHRPHLRARRRIGRTFQITRLFSNLTVIENVLISMRFGRGTKAGSGAKDLAMEILELTGLSHKANDLAGNLSLAQRKRLELARALGLEPRLILLDEVFAGLNPRSIQEISDLLLEIKEQKGTTIILVEHVLKALFRVAPRVIVLSEGRIIYEGDKEGLKEEPEVIKAYLGERYARDKNP
jgi:branched-chain amino acid transport system ATP-binding protein